MSVHTYRYDFCQKIDKDVKYMLTSDTSRKSTAICDECVDLCVKLIKERKEKDIVR